MIIRLLVAVAVFSASSQFGLASPGAHVPWTTYEAEDMSTTGTVLGPGYDLNSVEGESSGRKCVKLSDVGQYVEFKAKAGANALVVRYSLPNTPNGEGIDSSIGYYLNGKLVQKLGITSRYSNRPRFPSRNFYDEVRSLGPTINTGDTIRIEKEDAQDYVIIDLVDLEMAPAPLEEPAGNWLSVKDAPYHAAGDGVTDDTAALRQCIADAERLNKNVWAPPGAYLVTGTIGNLNDITIQGAGMWHTTFVGDPAVYNTKPDRRVRFLGAGNNIHLADFAIVGRLNHRTDSEENDGLGGSYGSGSTISRIWVEHTKTGCWLTNSNGLIIDSCRIRDTQADGINLCVGMRGTTVTNCATRGTGDDCFAIFPAVYLPQAYAPGHNVITHCTGQSPYLANGCAIYGGESNRIEDCLFQDVFDGSGVLISAKFHVGANAVSGATVVQRCDLIRCGGQEPGRPLPALQFVAASHPISNVSLSYLNIIDSIASGISFDSNQKLSQITIDHLILPDFGLATPVSHGLWAHSDTEGEVDMSDSAVADYRNDSPHFQFHFTNVHFSAFPR